MNNKSHSDIVVLDARFKGTLTCKRPTEQLLKTLGIQINETKENWTRWPQYKKNNTHPIGTFVDGIGVFDIADEKELQKMLNAAIRAHFTQNYVPDEDDE